MKNLNIFVAFLLIVFVGHSQSPGNVGLTNMSMWYSGDTGVSDTGTLEWNDRSSDDNHAQQPTAAEKATQSNLFNFNQTFTFDGTSDRFAISGLNYIDGQVLSDLSAFVVYATGYTSGSYNGNWSFIDFDRSESFNFYIHGNGKLAMSFQSEGTQDLVGTTTSNNGAPHIATYLFDSGVAEESVMRLDGFEDYSVNNTSSDITVLSDRYGFIADGSEATAFNGTKNNVYYEGDIAEIIFYDKGDLTTTDVERIESYLALKYGITLDQSAVNYVNSSGTNIWDAITYWNGVAGIIQDDSGAIHQKVAKSNSYEKFIVARQADFVSANNDLLRVTDVGNGKSLVFGHDNEPDDFTLFGVTGFEYLFNKTWLFQEKTGDVGTVYIAIDKSLFIGDSVDLIVSSNDTFDGSDSRILMTEGATHYYVAANIADGEYVSFVSTRSSKAPGGVFLGLDIWFKGDSGVTSVSGNISKVINQTDDGYDLSQTASANQPTDVGLTNFNPNITFDGTSSRMPIVDKNFTSSDNLNQVYIWTVFNTDFSSGINSGSLDTSNWAFLDFDRSEWFNASVHGDGTLQFAYDSGGDKDNYGVEVTNDGTAKLGGFIFDTSYVDSEETKIRVNGNEDLSMDRTDAAITSSGSLTRFGYVGDGSEATSFNSSANNGYFEGTISEVIYYENETLTDENINMIESYLAVKYGITLNTSSTQYLSSDNTVQIWNDLTYWNDVAAIGLDESSGLNQKQSKSTNNDAVLTIALGTSVETKNTLNTNTFDDNLDFFAWGNNGASSVISEVSFPNLIEEVSECTYFHTGFDRDWKVKNTGAVAGVTLQFDLSAFADPGAFDLLIDEDGNADYNDGVQRFIDTGSLSGTDLTFSNVAINDGEVFTLIRKNPEAQITYNGTWSGGNASGVLDNSATDLLKSVRIKNSVVLPAEANCKCLGVSTGAIVTVEDGKNLLVSDALDLEGSIYLYGDSQLVQTLDGEDLNAGSGSIYKVVTEGTTSEYRFNYWGSPVRNETTYDLETNLLITSDPDDFSLVTSPAYTNDNDGSSGTISRAWLYDFSNSTSWNLISETTDKIKGSGFTMKGLSETTNFVFSGKPNNGTIKLDLDEDNYYLVGNPYPSVISADDFNTYNLASSLTTGTIYFWDQSTGASHYKAEYEGGYATRAGGLGAEAASVVIDGTTITFTKEPNEFIAVGQGFMVTGATDGSQLEFKNSFRSSDNGLFFKSNKKANRSHKNDLQVIRIGFEYEIPEGTYHRQLVASPRGLSMDYDEGYDAPMFDYFGNDMYWDLDGDLRFIITGVPYVEEAELEVPLGIVLDKKTEIRIKLDDLKNYEGEVCLLDKETQSLIDLTEEDFSLTLESGTYEERFSLLLKSDESLSVETNLTSNFYAYFSNKNDKLIVVSSDFDISELVIYSSLGKKIASQKNKTMSKSSEILLENITAGVYILKINSSKGTASKKIIISKKEF